jgi:EAL domain-containing protein (putative c-di-GMP-specific phosphodiesterase class I)
MKIDHDLSNALKNNEFVIYYQPKFNLQSNSIVGMEALLRWQHDHSSLIFPDDFIPHTEESRLILEIGEWVLNEACKQCKKLQTIGLPNLNVSINISSRQFEDPTIVSRITKALQASSLDPAYLELEITESLLMPDDEDTHQALNALKKLGIKIAVDDFGTGYSSLKYLSIYPISSIKIDKYFITHLENNKNNGIIIKSLINLAHHLQLSIVAEGVETQKQFDFLKENGCDEIQGFIIGQAVLAEQFMELNDKIKNTRF